MKDQKQGDTTSTVPKTIKELEDVAANRMEAGSQDSQDQF